MSKDRFMFFANFDEMARKQIHPENAPGAMLALTLCEQLAGE